MNISRYPIIALALSGTLALSVLLSGCTKEDSGGSSGDSGSDTEAATGNFRTSCGTVVNGELENPVDPGDGVRGALTYIGPNLISIALKSGPQLIKLHGLDEPYEDWKRSGAETLIKSLIDEGDGYLYSPGADCGFRLSDGGQGVIGQVFSASGKSFSESLIKSAYANLGYDSCQGGLISSCYSALEEETSNEIAGELEAFLWKPVSDSTGKLAIHTSPYDTIVIVNGETGTNQGPGNGYANLARFNKPGCAYGAATVRVVNERGAAYMFNGQPEIKIPDGCSRWKKVGNSLQRNVK
jgi:hypothetical protein